MSIIKNARTRLATVGVKILVGVTLVSNLFIGALLYGHLQSSDTVAQKVNEILQHVEEIRTMEQELIVLRRQQRHFSLIMGGLAAFANMIALFFLVQIIVEKPLHKLTNTIGAINSGKSPAIPYRHRRDQIGILSGAINNFSEALLKIKNENDRKAQEKVVVDGMFATVTDVVDSLDNHAKC